MKSAAFYKSLRVAAVVFLIAGACSNLFALGGGTTNADFLKIGVGARPSAMGGAFTAVADDSNASYWNPAGMASVPQWNLTFMHLVWFLNTGYDYLSVVMPVDNMTNVGVSANYFWVPPFDSTADVGNPFAPAFGMTALSYDLAVTISIARIMGNLYTSDFTIGNIAIGANLTYISRKVIDTQLPAIFTLDIGMIANITDSIRFGLVISDIGNGINEDPADASVFDPAPFAVRAGLSGNFVFSKDASVLVGMDVTKPIDLSNPDYTKWFFNLGCELNIFKVAFIRAGYELGDPDKSFTVGGGFGVPGVVNADYAFIPHAELGNSHRISLTFAFGGEVPRPVIGAPRPPQKVAAISGDKIVSVGWDPNPEGNIIGYNIYYKQQGLDKYNKLNKDPIMEESKFKAVLNNDVTYDFVVTAINNRKLESIYSNIVSATPQRYVARKPAVVEGVLAKTDEKNIVVLWEENKENFVAGYNLYYKKAGDDKYKRLNRSILRESKATLAGLKGSVKYSFIITAVSKDGMESDYSESVSAELPAEDSY